MASRYRAIGTWREVDSQTVEQGFYGPTARFSIECADAEDTKHGDRHRSGAYRVRRDGRPVRRGRGGTVPFIGELAWNDAQRLFRESVDSFALGRAD